MDNEPDKNRVCGSDDLYIRHILTRKKLKRKRQAGMYLMSLMHILW